MLKMLLAGIAALFLATGAAARAAETFDWGKYCGDRNKYCDPSDSEDNKWQPPSTAELRACTKNRKLDYNCLRKSEPSSVLQSLPTSVQKRIKEIRERCLAIERENPPYGTADDDDGLMTFTLSGAQAVLVDELSFCGGECYHGVNCATGHMHLVEVYVRSGSVWRKVFSKQVTQPIFVSTENDPHTGKSTRFRALVIKIGAEDKMCPAISSDSTEWKRRSCDFVVKWDGAKFTFKPL